MNNRAQNTLSIDAGILDQTVSQWMPLDVQPARPVVYARGTDHVGSFQPIPYPDKWSPTFVQPKRLIVYAQGSFAETLYRADFAAPLSWSPTFIQPSRLIVYAKGSYSLSIVQGSHIFVTKFVPELLRGSSELLGPDPARGMSVLVGPDPRRGTSEKKRR
jgi:hypothetical protein